MACKVAYFVHDLADAAVRRRLRMLELGGAEVRIAGFRRGSASAAALPFLYLDLGQTADAKLISRLGSVAKAAVQTRRLKDVVSGADIILARNLETLAIASLARHRFAPQANLVYECLDIHRLLLSKAASGKLLRALESRLWRHTNLLLTSSPAFVENYFAPRHFPGRIELAENKVLRPDVGEPPAEGPASGPPWKIGYFGMLRCAKSLQILKILARTAAGAVQVILRGKPSPAIFPDLEAELANSPHIRFEGPYNGQADLRRIYSDVHFSWAIDFYEESQNSSWLLPNRLYESSYFGAVPIALAHVESGRWLERHGAGVRLTESAQDELQAFFAALNGRAYDGLAGQVRNIPKRALAADTDDCQRLVAILGKRRTQTLLAGRVAGAIKRD